MSLWDVSGAHRVNHPDQDDAEVARHDVHFRAAAAVGEHDRVLDIGCGSGQSARAAAESARSGRVLGVDLSGPLLERARALSAGLDNLEFLQVDAQTHEFTPGGFDLAISRFGTMFFDDPDAAFANIAAALRPGGRLVLLVWQASELVEWSTIVHDALGLERGETPPGVPDAFSLAAPHVVHRILDGAGFTDVTLTDIHEPAYFGRDTEQALSFLCGLRSTKALLTQVDDEAAGLARLRAAVAARDTGSGVLLDSHAWLVTATRR
jgi:SAM-dependent methyltransferase